MSPPRKPINFGDLRRVTPISSSFGIDRGQPIDRFYIERFLSAHAGDVRGRVLEFGDNAYTRLLGGDRVSMSDIVHADGSNPQATIVANLASAEHIADETFDCIICTQTLMYIYPIQAAIRTLHRILKPGGVVLATFPGISQISPYDMERWGEYWRFTTRSAARLFGEFFEPAKVTVEGHGNVLAALAFLHGLATEELKREELTQHDPHYELLISTHAVKA